MQARMKPLIAALMISIGTSSVMVQPAQAGTGKKVLGAVVVGGVVHHYYKKHKRKKRERRIREEQRRLDMQQMQRTPQNQPAPAAH